MATVNKSEFVDRLQDKLNCSKREAAKAMDAVFGTVTDCLDEGHNVKIYGFGSFRVKTLPAGRARNPRTGEPVQVDERQKVYFKPSKTIHPG